MIEDIIPIEHSKGGSALDGANCGPVYSGSDIGLWRAAILGNAAGRSGTECFEGFDVRAPGWRERPGLAWASRTLPILFLEPESGRVVHRLDLPAGPFTRNTSVMPSLRHTTNTAGSMRPLPSGMGGTTSATCGTAATTAGTPNW